MADRAIGSFWSRRRRVAAVAAASLACAGVLGWLWDDLFEKRIVVVVPGRIVRGAWQRPGPLRTIIAREGIRTVVTLTAINEDDPKYVDQARVVRETGVRWITVPMRGSRATLEQMAEAADLLADPSLQPVFFHCVAGHHRSSLAQAAYRVRYEGWDASRAWDEVAGLAWARPTADLEDRALIERFAASTIAEALAPGDSRHDARDAQEGRDEMGPEGDRPVDGGDRGGRRMELRDGELRDRSAGAGLSVGPAPAGRPGSGDP